MIEAPFSELDYSSDFLDEFHGFTDEEDNGDGFNDKIPANMLEEGAELGEFDPAEQMLVRARSHEEA